MLNNFPFMHSSWLCQDDLSHAPKRLFPPIPPYQRTGRYSQTPYFNSGPERGKVPTPLVQTFRGMPAFSTPTQSSASMSVGTKASDGHRMLPRRHASKQHDAEGRPPSICSPRKKRRSPRQQRQEISAREMERYGKEIRGDRSRSSTNQDTRRTTRQNMLHIGVPCRRKDNEEKKSKNIQECKEIKQIREPSSAIFYVSISL